MELGWHGTCLMAWYPGFNPIMCKAHVGAQAGDPTMRVVGNRVEVSLGCRVIQRLAWAVCNPLKNVVFKRKKIETQISKQLLYSQETPVRIG